MACSSSCRTQDHESFGACIRAKGLKLAYGQEHAGKDATRQKKADRTLDRYEQVRRQGIQPQSTRASHIEFAERMSDKTGTAYKADEY